MTDMPRPTIHRYEVAFQAADLGQGRSIIALTLTQEGEVPDPGTMFFLEPVEGITPEETARMAAFLTKYTARFGIVLGTSEPEGQ